MMKSLKKVVSIFLIIGLFFSLFTTAIPKVYANDTLRRESPCSVEIVSFMRGPQTDLRSSELLEARVTGYDGNVQDLIYEWTNDLGTYLYIYNSHNMYYIEGTAQEVEVYNNKIDPSNNMAGRSYKDSFEGQGYRWASVYGSNYSGTGESISLSNALSGTISVTVKDANGKVLCSDSHTGTVTKKGFFRPTYTYSGFIPYDIEADIDDVTIGIFEGDKRNVKDLLGESAILHITCVESIVSNGSIVRGKDHIKLTKEGNDYYITGTSAGESQTIEGDALVDLSITKNNCKFHYETSGTAETTVFVFKKPTTETTATTLTLTGNLDDRCEYFINHVKGIRQNDGTILFTGLNPNTEYIVEVRGNYLDENNNSRYAYAYVYDTTLPLYTGTVKVYLDGAYDSTTATASGTPVDIEEMVNNNGKLYLKELNGTEFIEIQRTTKGTYSHVLDTGSYHIYYEPNDNAIFDNQQLIMNGADRTRYVFFNSVTYKDSDTILDTEYHLTGNAVAVKDDILEKEGYIFTGWKDQDGNFYAPSQELDASISTPYILTAQWTKSCDVYVNVILDHISEIDNGHNNDAAKHDITFELIQRLIGNTGDFDSVAFKTIEWDENVEFDVEGYSCNHIKTDGVDMTYYTATLPTFSNVPVNMEYSLDSVKTAYDIVDLTTTINADGDVVIDVKLRYNPGDFDFTFEVELDEKAKKLPQSFKPASVDVKITSWHDTPYDDEDILAWGAITQHKNTYLKIDLDENGQGSGMYPVWIDTTDGLAHYHYRIEVVSYILPDGTIMAAKDLNNQHTNYITEDERYNARIEVTGGHDPIPSDEDPLHGAWYDHNVQQGTVKAIISIDTHTVTFNPNGGTFKDNTTENKIVEDQIVIPNLNDYIPTRNGGYVFDGWYYADENGNITDTPATSGDGIYDDVILIAKWKAPLTINGTVTIAASYVLDDTDTVYTINDNDRAKSAVVTLQKILPNGYSETIKSETIQIEYNKNGDTDIGEANYEFTEIPNEGFEYRILILEANYKSVYQNEPSSLTEPKNYDSYNEKDFIAKLGETETSIATVNAYLHFEPTTFDLKYQVNSAAIGEGFRPNSSEILILYDDSLNGVNPQGWAVISQMVQNNTYIGQETPLSSDGIGNNVYPVWNNKPDGKTIYNYSVLLNKYTIESDEYPFVSATAPFRVMYNGSTRYDAVTKEQTQLLTIVLVPRTYDIIFDVNFTETETDFVTNLDNYEVEPNKYATGHIWSYNTDISNVIPTREGYNFLGWYDENDNLTTNIDASVARNVTLYAKWEESYSVTFHANNSHISDDIFRTYYQQGAQLPESSNAMYLNSDKTLDSFYDIPTFTYETHNKYIFKGWYLDSDNENDSRPISWDSKYTQATDIYAHWIIADTVAQDSEDKKVTSYNGLYPEYDLFGVQIRDIEEDNITHYGDAGTGLRFLTVLSENIYDQINNITVKNGSGAEYGYVFALSSVAKEYANNSGSSKDYVLEYKGNNVNGKNTTTEYEYVQNIKCSGVVDHCNFENYRIYTSVVTFKNLSGEELEKAHSTNLVARSYIRYYDANGLYRTHYNNYTGSQLYSGCSTSFNAAKEYVVSKI